MNERLAIDATAVHPVVKAHWHQQWTPPLTGDCGINDPLDEDTFLTVAADPLLSPLFVAAAVEGTAQALKEHPQALKHLSLEVNVPQGAKVTPQAIGAVYEWLHLAQSAPHEVLAHIRDYSETASNWSNGDELTHLMIALICHANQAFIRGGYGR